MTTKEFINQNRDRFMGDLFELIRIPSISAQSEHYPDMVRTAEFWRDHLLKIGATRAEVMSTKGNPVVYAERMIDPKAKTVLIYGHYDVMPVEPLELWTSEPFEPVVRDGHIWARGADDDKGQSMIQAKGFETALELDYVKCNVKFLLEGEEEIGSGSLYPFLEENKELLEADFILVSDTSMFSPEIPSMTSGLRGLAYWEIEVTGPNRDLHSGLYGGAVGNPIIELSKMIAKIVDEDGRITIPGFYDDVVPLTQRERDMIAEVPYSEEAYCKELDIDATFGEKGYVTLERNSCRPCFDVCGIWGGYTGEGAKTVLPSKAYAKVSCRLVANQDPDVVKQQLIDYVAQIAPKHVRVEVRPHHGGDAYLCPIDMPAYRVAEDAFEQTFGKRPLALRSGGSIPIIAGFERILGLKSILMGFGLGSNAIHSPNENMPVDLWYKGIETVAEFYRLLGDGNNE